jgi:hypothetical protein
MVAGTPLPPVAIANELLALWGEGRGLSPGLMPAACAYISGPVPLPLVRRRAERRACALSS